jgi:hypothetical protein
MFNQPTKKPVIRLVSAGIVLTLGGGGSISRLRKNCEKHH